MTIFERRQTSIYHCVIFCYHLSKLKKVDINDFLKNTFHSIPKTCCMPLLAYFLTLRKKCSYMGKNRSNKREMTTANAVALFMAVFRVIAKLRPTGGLKCATDPETR